MKIETQFNIGNTAWVMENNKPCSFKIDAIRTHIVTHDRGNYTCSIETLIEYQSYYDSNKWWNEKELFKTKEELRKSIFGE